MVSSFGLASESRLEDLVSIPCFEALPTVFPANVLQVRVLGQDLPFREFHITTRDDMLLPTGKLRLYHFRDRRALEQSTVRANFRFAT